MYVCICNGITDKQICCAVKSGCKTMSDLRKCLNVATQCGKCASEAKEILIQTSAQTSDKV